MTTPPGSAHWDGATYDRVSGPQERWGRGVVARLALDGSETVMDAGCGSGRVTEVLLERLPRGRVIAVDASPSMLAQARRRLSQRAAQVQFRQADLLELDVQTLGIDSGVDGILSTSTFHWVTDHERLFASLAGVLRPGGQLVAQCGGEGNLERLLAAVRSLGMERRGMWLYASVEDTASRLRDAGFADVQVWSNPEPTPFVDQTALAEFLEAVCLRDHLAGIPRHARRAFVARVVAQMPEPVLDYVRLNIVARRSMGRHAR